MATITVESSVTVNGRLASSLAPVTLAFREQEIRVAELIRRTVEEQVRVLQARLQPDSEESGEAREALARQYGGEIERDGAAIDAGEAVRRAQEAFHKGYFVILIDGKPAADLEEKLMFAAGTSIRFVRLTPLVGG